MKHIYCAACGLELAQLRKVVRGDILSFVEPHHCIDPINLPPIKERDLTLKKKGPNPDFDSLKVVKKLNGLVEEEKSLESLTGDTDKSDKDHLMN